MPKGADWFNLAYVTVGYLALALGLMLFIEIDNIRANWPKYRCNPMYMPLSKNVQEDFTFCVQNMEGLYECVDETNYMDYQELGIYGITGVRILTEVPKDVIIYTRFHFKYCWCNYGNICKYNYTNAEAFYFYKR